MNQTVSENSSQCDEDIRKAARRYVREYRQEVGRPVAVLDDDPTGSQTVGNVGLLTEFTPEAIADAVWDGSPATYLWTNSRAIKEEFAYDLNYELGSRLYSLGAEVGTGIDIVSRGDSTLRGHVIAEVEALQAARASVLGEPCDAVLFAPAYFEAGRVTEDGVHWVIDKGVRMPVGASEYARDSSFGYRSSRLSEFLEEKSHGRIQAQSVLSVSLTDIREGGVDRVAELLAGVRGGSFVVVDGLEYADYEVVAQAIGFAQRKGSSLLFRAGPSFVRAMIGMEPEPALDETQLPHTRRRSQHGVIVVGSHVSKTNSQIEAVRKQHDLNDVVVDVEAMAEATFDEDAYVRGLVQRVKAGLSSRNVLLATSRITMDVGSAEANLTLGRRVSEILSRTVSEVLKEEPAWIVAKGGVTSHDVAVDGIGLRRGRVLGQLEPGIISLIEPVDARQEAIGMPYIVFAGNVGNDLSLVHVVEILDRWVRAWR